MLLHILGVMYIVGIFLSLGPLYFLTMMGSLQDFNQLTWKQHAITIALAIAWPLTLLYAIIMI